MTAIIFCIDCATVACGLAASVLDGIGPDAEPIAKFRMEEIKTETPITVLMKDGSKEKVKYLGVDSIPFEEYSEKYTKSREDLPDSIILPNLGDSITLAFESWGRKKARFFGFGHNYITIHPLSDSSRKKTNLKTIKRVYDKNGKGFELQDLISQNYTPLSSRIIVENEKMMKVIDINKVEKIQLNRKKDLAKVGIIVGAVIDVIIIYSIYAYAQAMSSL